MTISPSGFIAGTAFRGSDGVIAVNELTIQFLTFSVILTSLVGVHIANEIDKGEFAFNAHTANRSRASMTMWTKSAMTNLNPWTKNWVLPRDW
jgi:hypothetical protein